MSQKADKPVRSTAKAPGRRRRWLPWLLGAAVGVAVSAVLGSWYLERWCLRADALTLARQQDWTQAEPKLRQAAAYFPADVEVARELAKAQQFTGKMMTEAEPYVSRWCELEPNNPEPFRMRLHLYLALNLREKALADGQRLLQMEPDNFELCKAVIELSLLTGNYAEAAQLCRTSLAAHEGDPELQYLLAKVYYFQGKNTETDAVLDDLLKNHSSYAKALLLRGTRLCEDREYSRAIPLLRQVLADTQEPENKQQARYQLSQALAGTGQKEEAEELLRRNALMQQADRLVEDCVQQPQDFDIQIKAARTVLKAGPDALSLVSRLERILENAPGNKEAHRLLAEFYEAHGNGQKAAEHLHLAGQRP